MEVKSKGIDPGHLLKVDIFLDYYPRYPDIDTVNLTSEDQQQYLALAPCTTSTGILSG